jgi:xanthine dehydrogenase YagS FAD-binding subunit
MFRIIFRNPMRPEVEVRTAETIAIAGGLLGCAIPPEFSAVLKNSMWWLDGEPYTSADLAGAVMVAFSPNVSAGPYFHVRLVSEFLYNGDTLLARRHEGGSTAGNILQRTRCVYFRNTAMPCNKREPGTGCPAIGGGNRMLAVLGVSDHCNATNPSDMCVALAALEATIHVQGPTGVRAIPFADFHLLPGNTPDRETVLEPGDLITHVTLPPPVAGSKQHYLKLRDRASYEFALASAAVVLSIADEKVTRVRIALGGVGTKPWRSPEAEALLVGQPATQDQFRKAAEAALRDAKPQTENRFKVELAKRCLVHALKTAMTA